MRASFFGRFLVRRGVVRADDLGKALAFLESGSRRLGELALHVGLLDRDQVARVRARQAQTDERFGEAAVAMGLLSVDQVEQLLHDQREGHVPLGEALVTLGYLARERLDEQLAAYAVGRHPSHGHRLGGLVASLLPGLLEEQAGMVCGLANRAPWSDDLELPCSASITLDCAPPLHVTLMAESSFAEALASAALGRPLLDVDTTAVWKGLREFLTLLGSRARDLQDRQEFYGMLEESGLAELSEQERSGFVQAAPVDPAASDPIAIPIRGGPGEALLVLRCE